VASSSPPGPPTPRDSALRIDPAQLARLGGLPIQARVIVEGALSGLHRAAVHGSSVEFAEHKEYSPGDELRHVDWKAYAKLDRYYVKQFEQESQLTVYLVLDASASMAFSGGGLAKLHYGGLALAALAYLVIQQQDKVGLISCGDAKLETLVPPRARTSHLHDLMAVLESILARGGTGDESPAAALSRIAELTRRRRALIVLASDLFDPSCSCGRSATTSRCSTSSIPTSAASPTTASPSSSPSSPPASCSSTPRRSGATTSSAWRHS
jgi:uncharacterized protein (DUF58 family)